MHSQTILRRYMAAVIIVGIGCFAAAVITMPMANVDLYLPVLAIMTVVVGSRVSIRIPRFKSHIAVSDTFIFLTLLLYGGEFAIILSAVEAFFSARRFCNHTRTVAFNAASVAISTSAVYLTLRVAGLYSESQLHGHPGDFQAFVFVLSIIVLVQFGVNTLLAAIHDALQNEMSLWSTWTSNYIWAFFSYFIGASGSAVLIQLSDTVGIGIIFAVFPVTLFVYLSYRMYMRNVENSIQQAEVAERHAKLLEEQAVKLKRSEGRFRSAFDFAPIGIGLVTQSGRWVKVNRALQQLLGYSEEEFLAKDFQGMTVPEDLGKCLVKIHEVVSGKEESSQLEHRYIHKDGHIVWISWCVSSVGSERDSNLIFQVQDITDKRRSTERLHHDATHDALTGLPNRANFMQRLQKALDLSKRTGNRRVSILFIDLDRFKYVNDSLGHLVGDLLLKGIADRLRECMRPDDLVARLGGDEFTILIEGGYEESEISSIADRINTRLAVPFDLNGHEVFSSASIGILHQTDKHESPEDMMRDADTAMYQAKRAGKARHETFNEQMHNAAKETLQLETDLRRAVERNEICNVYQPIYCIENGEMIGIESLARWYHPSLGKISPSKFIPLAEEIGLIDKLCEQAMRQSCRDIGMINMMRSPEERLALSVNLSCRQFAGTALVQSIKGILDETAFDPRLLNLEITESVLFEHADRAVEMLIKIREFGIDIHIDDFGTGYSNLSYLTKLPVSTLKLDRSFVSMSRGDGSEGDRMIAAIVTLSKNMGLKVVAEGVETAAQLELLSGLDCEMAQGYHFARPMRFEDLRTFLASGVENVEPAHLSGGLTNIVQVQ